VHVKWVRLKMWQSCTTSELFTVSWRATERRFYDRESEGLMLIIYEPFNADANAFIDVWAARYTGYDNDFYEANVGAGAYRDAHPGVVRLEERHAAVGTEEELRGEKLRRASSRTRSSAGRNSIAASRALQRRRCDLADILAPLLAARTVSDLRQ
jgi:hypothetical protein